jgi:hypothetical protein
MDILCYPPLFIRSQKIVQSYDSCNKRNTLAKEDLLLYKLSYILTCLKMGILEIIQKTILNINVHTYLTLTCL